MEQREIHKSWNQSVHESLYLMQLHSTQKYPKSEKQVNISIRSFGESIMQTE